MSTLTLFRENFTHTLRANIDSNLARYKENSPWANTLGLASQRDIPTTLKPSTPLQLSDPEKGDLKDTDNAIRIHKAFPTLTPLQARDPRIWTRLCHVELWDYMRKRWPAETYEPNRAKVTRYVQSRYFIPQSQSRSLLRNGISRLWWTAALSYDESRENPYELTKILFSNLDITQTLLERNFGRAPEVTRGFLTFLQKNESELLTGGNTNRNRIRHFGKFLNLYGGVCLLDALTSSDVVALLEAEFARILPPGNPVAASA